MKKILALVFAVALVFGIGEGVKKATEQAGNPPIGGFTDTEEVAFIVTDVIDTLPTINMTTGNPPIGG